MKIGIIQERKNPPDFRVPFTPKQCAEIQKLTGLNVVVESSPSRSFSDKEYEAEGIQIVSSVDDCDVLFGVKEVPIDAIIPNKKYFFFSHTIKKQPYNQKLLAAAIEKNIQLVDYECLKNNNNQRVLGFGEYAGIVGTYNAFRTLGIKRNSFDIPPANQCKDYNQLVDELKKVNLPELKITLTGTGRVGMGSKRILMDIGATEVEPRSFISSQHNGIQFTQLGLEEMYQLPEHPFDEQHFYKHSEEYEAITSPYIIASEILISAHFWDNKSAPLFTHEEIMDFSSHLEVIADITCDIKGSIPTTIRSTTIQEPIYYLDPFTMKEISEPTDGSIAIMAVDNLPCELPRDASEGFGNALLQHVVPELLNWESSPLIQNASICKKGQLTENYLYLADYLSGNITKES
jgi:alanine dehydrogenase